MAKSDINTVVFEIEFTKWNYILAQWRNNIGLMFMAIIYNVPIMYITQENREMEVIRINDLTT